MVVVVVLAVLSGMIVLGGVQASPPGIALGSAPEPYPPLHGGGYTGKPAPLSPDPLVQYVWSPSVNRSQLQIFTLRPKSVTVQAGSCKGSDSLTAASPHVTVTEPVRLLLDFGNENPAWLEFDSPDLDSSNALVTLGVGEYDTPWQDGPQGHKAAAPTHYNDTYRLETNSELYEGVRFGFIEVAQPSTGTLKPFTISAVRLVVQVRAVSYAGHFHSAADPMVERVWWTAAWTVKACLQASYFGSILMDRGDREAWTGDAHPSQATALVAFHNLDFIKQDIASSIHGSGAGFPTYQCYWVLSIMDYFHYTGDRAILQTYGMKVASLLEPLFARTYPFQPGQPGLGFVGWDDRTGAGFSNSSCRECELDYRMLFLRTLNETAAAYKTINASLSAFCANATTVLAKALREDTMDGQPWYTQLLLASAGDAVNAGLTTLEEEQVIFEAVMSDPLQICQLSGFNTYWTLQALGNMGKAEQALFVLRNCYGGMIAMGATTFWETFPHAPEYISGDVPWALRKNGSHPSNVPWSWSGITSLAHPWSAGPGFWISQNLLGVRPTTPGFQEFEVSPQLTGSLAQVSGVVPTVLGAFEISMDLVQQTATIVVPDGALRGQLAIPLLGSQMLRSLHHMKDNVLMGRLPVGDGNGEARRGRVRAHWVDDRTVSLTPGTHFFSWELVGRGAESVQASVVPAYPPPKYAATLIATDATTGGAWRGKYGKLGFELFNFCGGAAASTCAAQGENSAGQVRCGVGSKIASVAFADFGLPKGDCANPPIAVNPACSVANLSTIVASVCVGYQNCTLECSDFASDKPPQHGCNVTADSGTAHYFQFPAPCGGGKKSALVVNCTSGGETCIDRSRPNFVTSVVNAYSRGQLGDFDTSLVEPSSDKRALVPEDGVGPRRIGKLSEGVIIAVDVEVENNREYQLSAYFVDWERQGRRISVALMDATDYKFNQIAPSQLLEDFGDGVYLVWRVKGSVRVRVTHVGGDNRTAFRPDPIGGGTDALISALFFDA